MQLNWGPEQLTVPVGNVLVGDTGGNVEHDDTTLSVNVVSVTKTTELLLTSSVPELRMEGESAMLVVRK